MTDYIKRAEAIEAKPEYRNEDMIDKEKATYNKGWNDCNDAWVAIIKALPSAEAVQGWIPCSERLPDVGEIVIASWSALWSDAIVFARRYCEDDWEWAYEQGSDYWESARDYDYESNPEAWMPLPKPYKGGDDE